jgi:lactate 2-monooxygenase
MPDSPHSVPNPKASSPGMQRQFEIYQLGLAGKKLSVPVSLAQLEKKAAEVLSAPAYDYVAGGASGERTMRANLAAFERWNIVPRMLRDVSERDLSVELLGHTLPVPVLLGPVGVQGIIHPEADLASGRAAAALGVPFVLSTLSSRSIEDVAQAMGNAPRWFQLYWGKDHELTGSMLRRAKRSGYSALVVTLDTAMLGWRERDLQHPYLPFLLGQGLANYFSDPVFRSRLTETPENDPAAAIRMWATLFSNTALTWSDLDWLRQQTRLPILLKGILHPEDARRALDSGVDGIIVSNHGGRNLDTIIPPIEALPDIAQQAGGRVPLLMDGGIRRGTDALKALLRGASAVLIGRPYLYALAIAGADGVARCLSLLIEELRLAMGLVGATSLRDLNRDVEWPPADSPWRR